MDSHADSLDLKIHNYMKRRFLLILAAILTVSFVWAAQPKKKNVKKAGAKKEVKKETKKETQKKPTKKEAKNAAGEDPYGNTIAEVDSLFYILDDEKETATITVPADPGYYVGMKEIPEVIKYKRNLYSVTEVGDGAFEGCKGLTGVKFPETIVSIGDRAFKDCSKLKTLSLPADLVSVGDEAFMSSAVRAAKLPKSVLEIGDRAFAGTPIKSASFGREMTDIPEGAFQGCKELTKVTIPESITEIEDDAFAGC